MTELLTGDRYTYNAENVSRSPDSHGVYELYYVDEVVYIGRASGIGVTIRSRLRDHLGEPGLKDATSYRREVTESAITREQELLAAFRRHFGRLPRHNKLMP